MREEVVQVGLERVSQLDGGQELKRHQEIQINSLLEENARLKHENQQLIIKVEELQKSSVEL